MPEVDAGLRAAHAAIAGGGRTAQAFEEWRDDYLEQVAVAWVLACVFVRYLEDNDLIAETYLAGHGRPAPAGRGRARGATSAPTRTTPTATTCSTSSARSARSRRPATCSPRARRRSGPSAPRATRPARLLAFWREIDPETGGLRRSFARRGGRHPLPGRPVPGPLRGGRKKYALLQTPEFVEEFILDRTLTPALDEFGLETVRLIDPTCGSGHFLLGAFRRLFDLWTRARAGRPSRSCWRSGRSTRCHGVD